MVERVTITIDEAVLSAIDGFMNERGYSNRSEAIRDLLRRALGSMAAEPTRSRWCAACVSYIYDFAERDLNLRLAHLMHDHHDLAISTMRTPLDHHHAFETMTIIGPTSRVLALADAVVSERGIKFGNVNPIPLDARGSEHRHPGAEDGHVHLAPAL